MNNVVLGAPSDAAVPSCVLAIVGKQLSAEAMLEAADDVLVELEELIELEVLEVLEALDVAAEELLSEAPAVDVELVPPDFEDPPAHAVTSKQTVAKMLTKL